MEIIAASFLLALRLLMALALYAFLTWALLTMWREIKQQTERVTDQDVLPILLALHDQDKAERLRFTSPEITIGRHPSCEWVLTHETISSRHARLLYHHDQWWLEDLGSKNGTFLNEERVVGAVVLHNQDRVRCGQSIFSITFDEKDISGGSHE